MIKLIKKICSMVFFILILPLMMYEGYYQFGRYRQNKAIQTTAAATNEAQEGPSSTTNIKYVDRGYYWNYPFHQKFISYNEDGEKIIIDTDALGFRNPKIEKEVDILLLGDSFTSAANTKNELTFASHLRNAGYSVYNAGIDGTGTIHQAHILKDVLEHVKPKLVVLNFYLGNDFRDNFYCADLAAEFSKTADTQSAETPIIEKPSIASSKQTDSITVLNPNSQGNPNSNSNIPLSPKIQKQVPLPQGPRFVQMKAQINNLKNSSGVLQLIYNKIYLPTKYEGIDMSYYNRGEMLIMAHKNATPHPDVDKALQKTQNALASIKQLLDAKKIKFVVVGIPSKAQVMRSVREISNFDSDKKGQEFFSTVKNDLNFDKPDLVLQTLCQQNHIHYVSLLSSFRKHQLDKKLFYHFDSHWNYIGQETAANEVVPKLKNFLRSDMASRKAAKTAVFIGEMPVSDKMSASDKKARKLSRKDKLQNENHGSYGARETQSQRSHGSRAPQAQLSQTSSH